MIGIITVINPAQRHAEPPERSRNAAYAFFWLLRPITNSEMNIGRQIRHTHARYIIMKAAPPFSPTRYGNLHRLPRPTAEPAIARRTPKRLPKLSLLIQTAICLDVHTEQTQNQSPTAHHGTFQNALRPPTPAGRSVGKTYQHPR